MDTSSEALAWRYRNRSMTHIALQELVDGKNVEWMEKVSEEQYKMADTHKSDARPAMGTLDDVLRVAPALARYTQGVLLGDLWKRPDLSPRGPSRCYWVMISSFPGF
jgi:4-carboxymuconolactone decarboxylase